MFYDEQGNEDAERKVVYGRRFDIPSGTAVRFEPGDQKEVRVIDLAGTREVWGVNGKVNGKLKCWTYLFAESINQGVTKYA